MMGKITKGKMKNRCFPVVFHTKLDDIEWLAIDLGTKELYKALDNDHEIMAQSGGIDGKEIILWTRIDNVSRLQFRAGQDNFTLWLRIGRDIEIGEYETNKQALYELKKD
jgi:hypothetical protein